MLLRQIGFALGLLFLATKVFAIQCPPADKVQNQRISGWSTIIFYTDNDKVFTFQKESVENTEQGREISCYYSYFNPDTHRMMPPALVLRTLIN